MLKVGWKASAEQFGPRELVDFTVRAEQDGLDSVFISDHFQPWRHNGGHAPFAMSWLAAVGERTERITLGTSVMTPTFRYNPAVVAQAFGTLGVLNPGRIVLGIGTGEALNEVAVGAAGSPWPEFKERFARLREAVTLMRRLWTEERVSFEGDYYTTHDATVYDRPESRCPIYVAAGGPLVARYAGRSGDGFICTSGKGRELYEDKLLPAVDEGLAKAGPHPRRHRPDDRDQAVLRPRPRRGAAQLPLLGAAVADRGAEARRRRPGRDGAPRRRAPRRAHRQALDRHPRPGGGRGADQQYVDWGFDHLVVPRPGPRPGPLPRPVRRRRPSGLRDLG